MTVATSAVIMQREIKAWPQVVYIPTPVEKCGYMLVPLQIQLQGSSLELCFPSLQYSSEQTKTRMDLWGRAE